MKNYYVLAGTVKPHTAFACPDGIDLLPHELTPQLEGKDIIPFEFTLKSVKLGKNGTKVSDKLSDVKHLWLDYQPNDFAWPLMSNRLKDLVAKHLTGKEHVVWMKTIVKGNGEQREYYVPRFEKELDVLDKEKSTFVKASGDVFKAVYSIKKIENFGIFYRPGFDWKIPTNLYMSEDLKNDIEANKMTGTDFENISVA